MRFNVYWWDSREKRWRKGCTVEAPNDSVANVLARNDPHVPNTAVLRIDKMDVPSHSQSE